MDRYRILSLDGGGSWALIQVKALIELFGPDKPGREVLQDFDLVAANSGGSIVLGCLVEDLSLSEILAFFNDEGAEEVDLFQV
jgi:patatin-like phospholipase/acyl hydrolase